MNSFLKIFLLVLLALVAIKLLPLTLAAGCLLGLAFAGLLVVGVSALAGMLAIGRHRGGARAAVDSRSDHRRLDCGDPAVQSAPGRGVISGFRHRAHGARAW